MVYAKFGGQTECIMGNSKIENGDFFRCSFVKASSSEHLGNS